MQFQVYYRATNKALRRVDAEADDAAQAVRMVERMLRAEREAHLKPLIAAIAGGKA